MSKLEDGILFSSTKIENINKYIAENINPCLYLAAYYIPKTHPSNNDYEGLFWCAVTNINTLFRDCMPNFTELIKIFEEHNLATKDEKDILIEYEKTINKLRSVYCHNQNATIYSEHGSTIKKARLFFSCFHDFDYDDDIFFTIPPLSNEKWRHCLNEVNEQADYCINDLMLKIFKKISVYSNKNAVVEKWIDLLAQWFNKNQLLFPTIKEELLLKANAKPLNKQPTIDKEYVDTFIKNIKSSIKNQGSNIENEYKKIINDMTSPALPYTTIKILYDKYEYKI